MKLQREKIEEYSQKYRSHQLKLSKGIMIFLLVIGIIIIGSGLFVAIYDFDKAKLIVGLIMIITGIADIPLAIKFNKIVSRNINALNDIECYKRYCKIYGFKE